MTNEIKEKIKLLELKKKILWIIKQTPVNEEQRIWIKKGKEELTKVNMWLRLLNVELSN